MRFSHEPGPSQAIMSADALLAMKRKKDLATPITMPYFIIFIAKEFLFPTISFLSAFHL